MEIEKDINVKILAITMQIQEKHPELSKYLKEIPVTIPNDNKLEINAKILEEYYHSLINILKKHSIEQLNPMTTVSEVLNMVTQMDLEGFGAYSNTEACTAECPKIIHYLKLLPYQG